MKYSIILLIVISCLNISNTFSRQIVSIQNGIYSNNSTWDIGNTPAAGDTITISNGHTVTVNNSNNYSGNSMLLIVEGTLKFSSTSSYIKMPSGSAVDVKMNGYMDSRGAGGNNRPVLYSGNTALWIASNIDLTGPVYLDENYALPISLVYFKSLKTESGQIISWETSSEINNDRFELEKSVDGTHWINLTTISGAGNSNHNIRYEYLDNQPVLKNVYYRLKQFDFNGELSFNGIIVLNTDNDELNLKPVQNVFSNTISIISNINGLLNVQLIDFSGKVVMNKSLTLNNQGTFNINDLENLQCGYYLLSLESQGKNSIVKLYKEN